MRVGVRMWVCRVSCVVCCVSCGRNKSAKEGEREGQMAVVGQKASRGWATNAEPKLFWAGERRHRRFDGRQKRAIALDGLVVTALH
jgi:hypothetical protein